MSLPVEGQEAQHVSNVLLGILTVRLGSILLNNIMISAVISIL